MLTKMVILFALLSAIIIASSTGIFQPRGAEERATAHIMKR